MGLRDDFRDWLSRKLAEPTPDAWVEQGRGLSSASVYGGGGHDRSVDDLEHYEEIYMRGGPVSQLVDTRANMVFGTGTHIQADIDAAGVWLEQHIDGLDNLLIDIGRKCYIYGDAWLEVRENRMGGFHRLKEMDSVVVEAPEQATNEESVEAWSVQTDRGYNARSEMVPDDELPHFRVNKQGHTPYGLSLIGRNLDEIERFAQNQNSRQKFLQRHATPRLKVTVGQENGPPIEDRTLKRVRTRIQQMDDQNDLVTGRDVDAEYLNAGDANLQDMLEDDLTILAAGFGVPEEMVGLGRGSTEATAKVRLQAFERDARAEQRALADQFTEQVLMYLLDEYSPFDAQQANPQLEFGDPVADRSNDADFMNKISDIITVDEAREIVGLSPYEGDEDDLGIGQSNEGGGLFMSSGEQSESGPERELVLSDISESELVVEELLTEIQEKVLWSEENQDRELFAFDDEDVPEFAKQLIRDAIRGGAVFDTIESIDSDQRAVLQNTLMDSLDGRHGWSLNSLRDNLQDVLPQLSQDEAERIARTETQAIVNDARERGYETRDNADELRFRWVGPDDSRETEACAWIKEQVDDDVGVPMGELQELVAEANQRFIEHEGRKWTPHINCRHTFVRVVNPDVELQSGEALTVRTLGHDTVATLAEIPQYLTDEISEDRFVPPKGAAEQAQRAKDYVEDNGAPNPDAQREGLARMNQIIRAVENDEPLAPEFVVEIAGFHARHRAQGNHECDRDETLEPENIEGDHDPCLSDNGYFSDKTWGGDPAAEWAEALAERIEEVESERNASSAGLPPSKFGAGDWVLFDFEDRERYGRITRMDEQSITLNGETVTGESDEHVYEVEIWSKILERPIHTVAMAESEMRRTAPPDNKMGATAD